MKNSTFIIIAAILLFLCALILWHSPADAQTIDTSFIFRGVNNSVNEFLAPIGTASSVFNADFGRTDWVLNKRKGWSVYQYGFNNANLNGHYTGLFPYINRDGDRRMFVTWEFDTDSSAYKDFPWALLSRSNENGITISGTNAYHYWYYGSSLWGTIYNNTAIFSNGFNRPLYYRGNNVRPLVEVPPGSWDMAPFADTTTTDQLLNGDYSYAFQVAIPCSAVTSVQGIYYPHVDSMNLQAILYRFHIDDDWVVLYAPQFTCTTGTCNPDSTIIRIGRTRAGGKYWEVDSFFQITEVRLSNDTTPTALIHILDSIPDTSLGGAGHLFIGFVDTVQHTADTTNDSLYRLGQPTWLGCDTCAIAYAADCKWRGIAKYLDTLESAIWKATHYFVLYYDSSTGMISDSSPSVRIPVSYEVGDDTLNDTIYDYAYRLGLPSLTTEKNHLWRLICRGQEILTTKPVPDTAKFWYVYNATCVTSFQKPQCYCDVPSPERSQIEPLSPGVVFEPIAKYDDLYGELFYEDGIPKCRVKTYEAYDTTAKFTNIGPFRIIDTIKVITDSVYIDSLSWADFESNSPLAIIGWTQPGMNYPVEIGDYVYMASGSRVYYSRRGIEGFWSADRAFAVSIDDGDEITGLLNVDGILYISKNGSIHRAILIGLDQHSVSQYVFGVGCIAPKTLINIPTGGFAFLSELGVQSFTPALVSQYKETGANRYSISGPIQSHLDAYSIDDKRVAYMWIDGFNNNLVLGFPTLDSSKVMSLNTSQWNTWDIAFRQTGRYTQTQADDLRPSDSILGIFNSSDTIALWGYSDKDSEDTIWTEWRSHWIGDTRRQLKVQLDKIAVTRSTYDTAADFSMVYTVFGWSDTLNEVTLGTHTNTNNTRRDWVGMNTDESDCFEIKIRTGIDSLAVQYIGLQYHITGTAKEE